MFPGDDEVTDGILSETLKDVNDGESHSESSEEYQRSVASKKQPRPSGDLEYTVTAELVVALSAELERRGRGADRMIAEALAPLLDGYQPHRTLITQIARGDVVKSSIAMALAKLLGCAAPPVHGDPLGDDGTAMRELKELDSESYEKVMETARKALDAHRMLAEVRGSKPTP